MYVYFYSLHVSGSHVTIIRRINYINTTSGICHSVYMTFWCACLDETASHPNLHTKRSSIQVQVWWRRSLIQTCTCMATVRNMTLERYYSNFLYRCLKFCVVTSMNIMQRLLRSYFEVTRPKDIGRVILIFSFRFIGDKTNEP